MDIYKIQVVNGPLIDNTGSVVDAIGVPGLIQLDGKKWQDLFNSTKDTYYLIFHEMLRSANVNDDNYIISSKINPFIQQILIKQRIEIENIILWADKIVAFVGKEEFWGTSAEGNPCRLNLYKNKDNGPRYYFSLGASPDKSKDDSKFKWIGSFLDIPYFGYNDIEITSEHVYFDTTGRYSDGPNDNVGVFATESLDIILDKNRFPETVYGKSTRVKSQACHLDPIRAN